MVQFHETAPGPPAVGEILQARKPTGPGIHEKRELGFGYFLFGENEGK